MAMSAPELSMFTFESRAHSSHVLHSLDEQRCRDMLCDVTVVVGGQSFRAHRSVLASCSEYFAQRILSQMQQGEVITLPPEVTVAGFEPLLRFAYSSKLVFGKDNILDIRSAASILGFRDLDEACFDFFLPKLISASKCPASFPRKTCCKEKCKRQLLKDCGKSSDNVLLDEKEVKPVDDSLSQKEVTRVRNESVNSKVEKKDSTSILTPVAEATNAHFIKCPKYRKFQLACGKENCATEKRPNSPASVIEDDRDPFRSPRCSRESSGHERWAKFPGTSRGVAIEAWKSGTHDKVAEVYRDRDGQGKEGNQTEQKQEEQKLMDIEKMEEEMEHTNVKLGCSAACTVQAKRLPGLILHHCPLKAFGENAVISESFVMDKQAMDRSTIEQFSMRGQTDEPRKPEMELQKQELNASRQERVIPSDKDQASPHAAETVGVRRETGRRPLKWQGCDKVDSDTGSSSDTGLDQSKCPWTMNASSEYEVASQSGVSSFNSGEDGDSETEGESESYTSERARQVQLPFPVDWIVDQSRNDFQQLLKQHNFTREQLEFVHDMRRRSKNRLAAQRCRKRKIDCIFNLQCEINKLKTEREKLITEKSHLNQLKMKTCYSVTALCQQVCVEANLQPEQLQVLAKYTSPDCPLSSLLPHNGSPPSRPGLTLQPRGAFSACPSSPEEASPCSSGYAVAGDIQPRKPS